MKKTLILLVLLNLAYFAWMFLGGKAGYTQPDTFVEGAPKIELLPESESSEVSLDDEPDEVNCYLFGPFKSQYAAKKIVNKISQFGSDASLYHQKNTQTLNYIVYMEPLPSRHDAIRKMDEISRTEIKNPRLVEVGKYKNSIVFDSFSNEGQASRHVEYVRFLGFDARYREESENSEIFWVDYKEQADRLMPVLRWSKSLDNKNNRHKISKTCD